MNEVRRRLRYSENEISPDFLSIKIHLKSAYKMTKYCCICGVENTKENLIESHHVRAIRKSGMRIFGFTQVMKDIGKKQIIICSKCHHNIHNGKYDSMKLSEFYDPELAKI
jgi:hypothetical protein